MMTILILSTFVLGYLAIAFEHSIKLNKAASSLLTGGLCWTIYAVFSSTSEDAHLISEKLVEQLGDISGILFFLLGAMTIVELIDAHNGFDIITQNIKTRNKRKLLWVTSVLAFFLSSIIDNLTTTIVMITLLRLIINDKNERLIFIGMLIIAVNAGGAWSPIGDVTTTMLWIGGQITTPLIVSKLFFPSLLCLLVPLSLCTFTLKGDLPPNNIQPSDQFTAPRSRNIIFFCGIGIFLLLPLFKVFTHLPPFVGMIIGLGCLWVISEVLHQRKSSAEKNKLSVVNALQQIDTPSILFFLGILMAIAALQSAGFLTQLANLMNEKIGNLDQIGLSIGILSAFVDNVPLVAGAIGMYDMHTFPTDHYFWHLLAYCAGTGGSALIIGSAAGVAAMGMEDIHFMWYLKRFSWLALIGYFAGAMLFIFFQ